MHGCKLWLCNVKFPVRRRQSDRLVRADGHWFAGRRTTATETWQASGEHVLCNAAFVLRFTLQPAAQATETLLLLCCCADGCQSLREKKTWRLQRSKAKVTSSNENEGVEIVLNGTKRCDRTWKDNAEGRWSALKSPLNWSDKTEIKKRANAETKNKWNRLRALSKLSRAEGWWSGLWAGVEDGGPGRL